MYGFHSKSRVEHVHANLRVFCSGHGWEGGSAGRAGSVTPTRSHSTAGPEPTTERGRPEQAQSYGSPRPPTAHPTNRDAPHAQAGGTLARQSASEELRAKGKPMPDGNCFTWSVIFFNWCLKLTLEV